MELPSDARALNTVDKFDHPSSLSGWGCLRLCCFFIVYLAIDSKSTFNFCFLFRRRASVLLQLYTSPSVFDL